MKPILHVCKLILLVCFLNACSNEAKKEQVVRPDDTDPTWEFVLQQDSFSREVQVEAIDDNNYIVAFSSSLAGINRNKTESWRTVMKVGFYGTDIRFLAPTPDGHFITGGDAQDVENGDMYGWLAKLTASGEILWQQVYKQLPAFDDIVMTPNGEIAVTGVRSELCYLSKMAANGDLIWEQYYEGVSYNGKGIAATKEGGFIVANASDMDTSDLDFHMRIIKTDAAGTELWSKVYKVDKSTTPVAIFMDTVGNYMAIGVAEDSIMKQSIFALKLNSEGKQLSVKTQYWNDDVPDHINDVKQTPEGTYVFTGQFINFRVPYRMMMGKLDIDGKAVWTRSIPRKDGRRGGTSIAVLPNGTVLGLGYTSDLEEATNSGEGSSLLAIPGNGGVARKTDY
jgi:hypothetical protein